MSANGNTGAYPMTADADRQTCIDGWGSAGLTKREVFAMAAMQAVLSNGFVTERFGADVGSVSESAVSFADGLLEALARIQATT